MKRQNTDNPQPYYLQTPRKPRGRHRTLPQRMTAMEETMAMMKEATATKVGAAGRYPLAPPQLGVEVAEEQEVVAVPQPRAPCAAPSPTTTATPPPTTWSRRWRMSPSPARPTAWSFANCKTRHALVRVTELLVQVQCGEPEHWVQGLHLLPLPLRQDLLPAAGLHRQAAQVHWGGELRLGQSWGTENILTIEIFLTHKIIFNFLRFLKSTFENIHPWSEGCGKFCPKLLHTHNDSAISCRCQGGINPYKEDIPAGTPCYTQSVSFSHGIVILLSDFF